MKSYFNKIIAMVIFGSVITISLAACGMPETAALDSLNDEYQITDSQTESTDSQVGSEIPIVENEQLLLVNKPFSEILNDFSEYIFAVHISDKYGYSILSIDDPNDPILFDFEGTIAWLLERIDLLFDEPFDGSVRNIIDFGDEQLYFYADRELMEGFCIFEIRERYRHEILVANFSYNEWRYLAENLEFYISGFAFEDATESIIYDFHRTERDLSVVLNFFAQNYDLLQDAQGEAPPSGMFHVILYFNDSSSILDDPYLNGYATFFINSDVHNRLWTLMENEFGVNRYIPFYGVEIDLEIGFEAEGGSMEIDLDMFED